jgi:hypothetical protein
MIFKQTEERRNEHVVRQALNRRFGRFRARDPRTDRIKVKIAMGEEWRKGKREEDREGERKRERKRKGETHTEKNYIAFKNFYSTLEMIQNLI